MLLFKKKKTVSRYRWEKKRVFHFRHDFTFLFNASFYSRNAGAIVSSENAHKSSNNSSCLLFQDEYFTNNYLTLTICLALSLRWTVTTIFPTELADALD